MQKEDLIKKDKEFGLDEMHSADSQSNAHSCQVIEKQSKDTSIDDQVSGDEDVPVDSSYILDLANSLNKQEKELTISQLELQTVMGEADELLSEYKVSVKLMKDKLADRKNKLGRPKA